MAYTKLGWVNDRSPALNQTNLNHMDQGIYDAHSKLSEYEDIFTGDVDESVQNWLDEHPEATTTVQDESLTESKFSSALKLKAIKDYVTPQMFGAEGDGVTDDTNALQDAMDYARTNKKAVVLISDYYISETINVPPRITVISLTAQEDAYKIYVADNIGVAFSCTYQNWFENIFIRPLSDDFLDFIAFDINGNSSNDIDSTLRNVTVSKASKGIHCTGRNLNVRNCVFSHCRYGVHIDIASGVVAVRGIVIDGCRFHGNGEEYEVVGGVSQSMWVAGNTAGILLDADNQSANIQESDIQIINCLSDQSGCFVKGKAKLCLIQGCYAVGFVQPLIEIDGGSSVVHPQNGGSWTISGCVLYGLDGRDGNGNTHVVPDYLIKISNYGRIFINSCSLARCQTPIYLYKATKITIANNTFEYIDGGKCIYADSSSFVFTGNTNQTTVNRLLGDGVNSSCFYKDNYGFVFTESNTLTVNQGFFEEIKSFQSGSAVSEVAKYKHFFIRRNDSVTMFEIYNYGTYYSSSVYGNASNLNYIYIDTSLNVHLMRMTPGASGSITELSVPCELLIYHD